jgi:hypothetical protein
MEGPLSKEELAGPKLALLDRVEIGNVPNGICHWFADSADIKVSNKSSESGQTSSKSRSADRGPFCTTPRFDVLCSGGSIWLWALWCIGMLSSETLSSMEERGLGTLGCDIWLDGGEGYCG